MHLGLRRKNDAEREFCKNLFMDAEAEMEEVGLQAV